MEAADAHRTTQSSGIKVRRPRAARACDLCRTKKNKCDELYPCTYCKNRGATCVYKGQDMSRRHYTPEYVRQLEEQIKSLSALAESLKHPSTTDDNNNNNASICAATTRIPDIADGLSSGDCNLHQQQQQQQEQQSSRSRTGGDCSPPHHARSRNAAGQEVSGVNRHTRNVEFYGSSSSVALLSHVQRTGEEPVVSNDVDSDAGTLLSNLHNPVFSSPAAEHPQGVQGVQGVQRQTGPLPPPTPPSLAAAAAASREEATSSAPPPKTHYPQCRCFLQSFFSSIHYVHPILDKKIFFHRCETLWSNQDVARTPSSFIALYYSILSLGALIGLREDEPIDGIGNLEWSRKFFDEAKRRCDQLGMVTDLEMVQCYFFLAKVCQNELNAHWSYMYVGLAVRTALAMGINRQPGPACKKDPAELRAETRTWWGLYSLETEMSFSMGRPDTLGADLYHNRQFPIIGETDTPECPPSSSTSDLADPPSCAIIKSMVDYSKIIRSICLGIYLPDTTPPRTVTLAHQIDQDLHTWAESLPESIRPTGSLQPRSLKSAKEAQWMKRQRLVLTMRYLNLKTLLFGSILLTSTSTERASIPGSHEGIQICLESAKQTIQIIYETYQHHDFFRTWFYNTTYTVFAASMILVYITQEAPITEPERQQPLLKLVAMAIEILETMDECVVALRSARLLHKAIEKAKKTLSSVVSSSSSSSCIATATAGTASSSTATAAAAASAATSSSSTPLPAAMIPTMPTADAMFQLNHYWGPLNILDSEMDFGGFAMQFADFDHGTNSLFMALDDQRTMES